MRLALAVAATTLALAFSVAPARSAERLDWCAPVVVRPDQRFDKYPDCDWIYTKKRIAERADVVFMSLEGAVSEARRPAHPMTCWGDTSYATLASYVQETNTLRPAGKPPLEWVGFVRFDLVFDTMAAQPGFDPKFLIRTDTPWPRVLDFFAKDRSGACPAGGCRWSDGWGTKEVCQGQCLRDYIDKAGGPGTHERIVYYLNVHDHPNYWGSAALGRLDDPAYRKWMIGLKRKAIEEGRVTMVDLNHKLGQWLPASNEGGFWLGAPGNADVTKVRKSGGAFTAKPKNWGYSNYVAGWHALAEDLRADSVPFSVLMGQSMWTEARLYDDPASSGVDEAALVRDVGERLATAVFLDTDGNRKNAERVGRELEAKGRKVWIIETSCGLAKKGS